MTHILKREADKKINTIYYLLASLLILIGAVLDAGFLWNLADLTMGLMALINVPVIIILSKYAFRALKDFNKQKKHGLNPVFHAKDIGLSDNMDFWN